MGELFYRDIVTAVVRWAEAGLEREPETLGDRMVGKWKEMDFASALPVATEKDCFRIRACPSSRAPSYSGSLLYGALPWVTLQYCTVHHASGRMHRLECHSPHANTVSQISTATGGLRFGLWYGLEA